MFDEWFGRLHGLAEFSVVDRHVTPTQHRLSLRCDAVFQNALAFCPLARVLRQEQRAHAVVACRRQFEAQRGAFLAVKTVWNLQQDTRAVTCLRVRTHRTAVGQVDQQLQALLNNIVAFLVFDIRDEADTAGVVFVTAVIKPLRLRKTFRCGIALFTHRSHIPCAAFIARRLDFEFAPAPVERRGTRWVQCRSVTTAFAAQKSGMPSVIWCDIVPFSITGFEIRMALLSNFACKSNCVVENAAKSRTPAVRYALRFAFTLAKVAM